MKQFIAVGTVRQELEKIEGVPQVLIEFTEYLLVVDHTKRPTARDVLGHPYFQMRIHGCLRRITGAA